MTEAEWLACATPQPIMEYLTSPSSRKWRLFACACCRATSHLLSEPCFLAIDAVERFVDGSATGGELATHFTVGFTRAQSLHPGGHQALKAVQSLGGHWRWDDGVPKLASCDVCRSAAEALAKTVTWDEARRSQAVLLRDVFLRPGDERRWQSAWAEEGDRAALRLAQAAYEERDLPSGHLENARLAVLSDALEEAGCTDEAILTHLRSAGPHVRGCWALDLVLGRE